MFSLQSEMSKRERKLLGAHMQPLVAQKQPSPCRRMYLLSRLFTPWLNAVIVRILSSAGGWKSPWAQSSMCFPDL